MSYTEWFIRALGISGLLQLLLGVGIFVWAIHQAFSAPKIRLVGIHGAVLLVPPLIGLLIGAFDCLHIYEFMRIAPQLLTPLEILHDVLLTVGQKIGDGLIVTLPAAFVLGIAWLFPIRRTVK